MPLDRIKQYQSDSRNNVAVGFLHEYIHYPVRFLHLWEEEQLRLPFHRHVWGY